METTIAETQETISNQWAYGYNPDSNSDLNVENAVSLIEQLNQMLEGEDLDYADTEDLIWSLNDPFLSKAILEIMKPVEFWLRGMDYLLQKAHERTVFWAKLPEMISCVKECVELLDYACGINEENAEAN